MIAYSDALGKILSPLQTVISVTSSALQLSGSLTDEMVDLTDAMAIINRATVLLVNQVMSWMTGDSLNLGYKDPLTGKLFIIDFAEKLSSILAPMQTVISIVGATVALANNLGNRFVVLTNVLDVLDDATVALVNLMFEWMNGDRIDFGYVNRMTGKLFIIEFAERLSSVLAPMQTTINITSSAVQLAREVKNGEENLADAIEVLDDATVRLVNLVFSWMIGDRITFGYVNQMTGKLFIIEFAQNLEAVLAPMQTAISVTSGAVDLANELKHGSVNLASVMTQLDAAVVALVGLMQTWHGRFNLGPLEENPLVEFSQVLQTVLSPIQTAVGTVTSLIDLNARLNSRVYDWHLLTMKLGSAIEGVIVQWAVLADNPDVKDALATFPEDFAASLNNALGSIKTAVDALDAVRGIGVARRGGDVSASIAGLVYDISVFVDEFSKAAESIDVSEKTVQLGTALGAIVGPVKSYIDDFYWIWRYVSVAARSGYTGGDPGFVPQQFKDIAHDLMILIEEINKQAAELEEKSPGAISAAATFSDTVEPIISAVNDALDLFGKIENRRRPTDFVDMVAQFGSDLTSALSILSTTFNSASEEGLVWHAQADVFGRDIGTTWGNGIIAGIRSVKPDIEDAIDEVLALMKPRGGQSDGDGGNDGLAGAAGLAGMVQGTQQQTPQQAVTYQIEVMIPVQQIREIDERKLAEMIRQAWGEIARANMRVITPNYS
jgi:hypothetical protein